MQAPIRDRRINRTRTTLQHALKSLIHSRGYENVTVNDICTEANVARSTFYLHFTGKDDLKRSVFEHLLNEIERQRPIGSNIPFDFVEPIFQHARNHYGSYKALRRGRGRTIALARIDQIFGDLLRKQIHTSDVSAEESFIPQPMIVAFFTGSFMALLIWWLDSGARIAPEQMASMYRRLACAELPQLK
ncbi:TetR/AcrR family transcriptional regulator [Neorhizobium sp. T25_27]|jgi:AcrR family transcriptional regulator|uniref:TetR/AcrR family transcriptional regulator n=1 Tax=Neorhizobium sp. T25_27 TaxID=2093831 RepID=UPI00155F34CA|nr:TetR/AcrR family transcriptional regulator [Neorhizobium sp. T25_27]